MKYQLASDDPCTLYLWNTALAAALFELLAHTEILLRNALHSALSGYEGGTPWFDDSYYGFDAKTRRDIDRAKRRATLIDGTTSSGRVVAELNFGFWRYLLANSHQTTVWPRVQVRFVGVVKKERSRRALENTVARLHRLRNRIAHHEPIFHLDVTRYLDDIRFVVGYIDPDAARWLAELSRVEALLAERP